MRCDYEVAAGSRSEIAHDRRFDIEARLCHIPAVNEIGRPGLVYLSLKFPGARINWSARRQFLIAEVVATGHYSLGLQIAQKLHLFIVALSVRSGCKTSGQ